MKIKILLKILIITFFSLIHINTVNAGTFASDVGGINRDFGAGRGGAQPGALSGLAGVKVSIYNVDSNTFGYSFALTNSTFVRSNSLSSTANINGTEHIEVFPYSWYSLNSKWAGSENGGFSYSASIIKTALCGTAAGNGCDATEAFYIIANKLTSGQGLGCYMSEDAEGNLILSQTCQQTLSKYRIILEPIYAFGIAPNFTFYTLKGIAQKGVSESVTSDPKYGFYINNAIENAKASEKHGSINQHGLPAYGNTVADKYAKLADKNSGYGYSVFYLIPGQLETTPTVEDIKNPEKPQVDNDKSNEKIICDENLNTLYLTSDYTYIENSSIQSDNPYCNVTCETTVSINYPNVFTVTPAGQKFELVYEPTINAKKTCQAKFDYEQWKINYEAAIKNEQDALEKYNKAKARADQVAPGSLTRTYVDECNCEKVGEGKSAHVVCYNNYYDIEADSIDYKTLASSISKATIYDISDGYCDEDSDYIDRVYRDPAAEELEKAKQTLKDRTQDRLNLEKYNFQCYTSLDSSQSDTTENPDTQIKNEDIFPNSYNNYLDIDLKPYTDGIEVKTNLESLSNVASGTSDTYSSHIYGITNTTVKLDSSIITKKNTKEIFTFEPVLEFDYQDGMNNLGFKTTSDKDKLLVEAYIVQDTGPHTENNETKTISKDNAITKWIYYDFGKSEYLNFEPYKISDIYRTVEYNYKFHEGTEYCGNIKGGEIKKCSSTAGNSDYLTLSTYTKYSNLDNSSSYFYNHNYPVKLNAKAGNYETNFYLTKKGVLEKITDFNGKFQCNYEVTNDLFTEEKELDVIFRSVATNKLDPNNRYEKNQFGENWLTKKGQKVKEIIELNGNDISNNTSKNTYNPENLEYSFTLTPTLINAIKNYNDTHKYSEYELACNEAGMECESKFLTELTQGMVNGASIQSHYNSEINTFNINNIRNQWKYYLEDGDSLGCDKIREDVDNMYVCPNNLINTTSDYDSLYKIYGVLP